MRKSLSELSIACGAAGGCCCRAGERPTMRRLDSARPPTGRAGRNLAPSSVGLRRNYWLPLLTSTASAADLAPARPQVSRSWPLCNADNYPAWLLEYLNLPAVTYCLSSLAHLAALASAKRMAAARQVSLVRARLHLLQHPSSNARWAAPEPASSTLGSSSHPLRLSRSC